MEAEQRVETIRRLYLAGTPYKRIVRDTGALRAEFRRAIADLPRTRPRLNVEQIEEIKRCVGTVRQVARRLGVSKSTVWYWRQKVYDAWAAEESDSDDVGPIIEFEQLTTPRRCSEHGRVMVWPCPVCAAHWE